MKQILLLFIASVATLYGTAQNNVGIGTTTPDASSRLEINSNNSGLLIPRLTAAQRIAISTPANGLLVFDTDSAAFAYRTGGVWLFLNGASTKANDWSTTGNAGTGADNFIGTTDAQPLRFKVNNVNAGWVDSTAFNTGFGFRSLDSITTGTSNTAIGIKSLSANTTGSNNTAYGAFSMYNNTTGAVNTANGLNSLYSNTTGSSNTANGAFTLASNTTGQRNTANGYQALEFNTTGQKNTANGAFSLFQNTTGYENTANGNQSLFYNSTGFYNTANGGYSLNQNSSGYYNTANGYGSLSYNTTGDQNTANGGEALLSNTTGIQNTASGEGSLSYNTTGSYNVAFGAHALYETSASQSNTAVGSNAGGITNNGNNNVFIGANAEAYPHGAENVIAIGYNVIVPASNQVTIGNANNNSYRAYANWTNISDGRFKRNIKENVPGLAFISKLRPVTYNLEATALDEFMHRNSKDSIALITSKIYKVGLTEKEKITYTGFIAQDVEATAKSLDFDFSGVDAPKNENDTYGLRYAEFVVPLVKAVQEQQQMIEDLKNSNADLQKQIDELKALIKK